MHGVISGAQDVIDRFIDQSNMYVINIVISGHTGIATTITAWYHRLVLRVHI